MGIFLFFTVLAPLVGGTFLFLSPRLDYRTARRIALGTILATLAMTLVLLLAFDPTDPKPQFAPDRPEPTGLRWI